jgi:AraC-like DNA-binding protein
MDKWDKINAVQRMQDYIKDNISRDLTIEDIAKAAGYSKRHAARIFKELLGRTPLEYVRAVRLTDSARELLHTRENILDIAVNTLFDTHEGFIRAFSGEFGITPKKYRKEKPPVKYFVEHPIKHYYSYLYNKEREDMGKDNSIMLCTVSLVRRPLRKLIVMRARKAEDYWSFCEEMGCDWEGLFNSIDSRMDDAAILELPKGLVIAGTTNCAAGVEVPYNYTGRIPEGCDCIELEECDMAYFQTEPFENEDEYGTAIDFITKAINSYNPKRYGFDYALELAPSYNFGASTKMGAKQAVPVRKIL